MFSIQNLLSLALLLSLVTVASSQSTLPPNSTITDVCDPPCDWVVTFCANDTGVDAYCECVYGKVRTGFSSNQTICVDKDDPSLLDVVSGDSMNVSLGDLQDLLKGIDGLNVPNYMDPDDKKIIEAVEKVMLLWVVGWCAAVMILFFTMCHFRCDRVIQMMEEICLILICLLIAGLSEEPSVGEGMCKLTSILLHYLIMSLCTFFCLEALHSYSMVTYVVPKNGFFQDVSNPVMINLAIGLLAPAIPVGVSVAALNKYYGTSGYHCWCNMQTDQAWTFLVPTAFVAFIATIIIEAEGQGKYRVYEDMDKDEYTSAKVSQGSEFLILVTSVLAYIFGLLAVHYQELGLYIVFIILLFILGPLVFFFHCVGNEKIRKMLQRMCPCIPCTKEPPPPPEPKQPVQDDYPDDLYEEPEPVRSPSPPPAPSNDQLQADTDWRDLYSWVSDGKRDNVKQGEGILFEQ